MEGIQHHVIPACLRRCFPIDSMGLKPQDMRVGPEWAARSTDHGTSSPTQLSKWCFQKENREGLQQQSRISCIDMKRLAGVCGRRALGKIDACGWFKSPGETVGRAQRQSGDQVNEDVRAVILRRATGSLHPAVVHYGYFRFELFV